MENKIFFQQTFEKFNGIFLSSPIKITKMQSREILP